MNKLQSIQLVRRQFGTSYVEHHGVVENLFSTLTQAQGVLKVLSPSMRNSESLMKSTGQNTKYSGSVNHCGGLHIPGSSVDKKDCPFGWKEFKCEA